MKSEKKTGQHPADDRDSDDEMEAPEKNKHGHFKSIVNEINEHG